MSNVKNSAFFPPNLVALISRMCSLTSEIMTTSECEKVITTYLNPKIEYEFKVFTELGVFVTNTPNTACIFKKYDSAGNMLISISYIILANNDGLCHALYLYVNSKENPAKVHRVDFIHNFMKNLTFDNIMYDLNTRVLLNRLPNENLDILMKNAKSYDEIVYMDKSADFGDICEMINNICSFETPYGPTVIFYKTQCGIVIHGNTVLGKRETYELYKSTGIDVISKKTLLEVSKFDKKESSIVSVTTQIMNIGGLITSKTVLYIYIP